jgi:YD repeat-containing protein
MKSVLKLVSGLFSIAFLLLAPSPAPAVDLWEYHAGHPPTLPPESYIYLDPNEACVSGFTLPPAWACNANPRNVRAEFYGNPSATAAECIWDTTCTCESCGIAGTYPSGGNTMTHWGGTTSKKPTPQLCPNGTTPFLGRCDVDTPKGKGPCLTDCELQQGNPANIASGNKYQREPIYRAASGGLALVLSYSSQLGTTYFQSSPFGKRWSAPYFARVRDSGQGIIAVERPEGRELEFVAPASGDLFVTDADVTDKLQRLPGPLGTVLGWNLMVADGDRVEEHDGPASKLRGNVGTLVRIRDRALVEHTMTYSTSSTPTSVAPQPGLLISASDRFGRPLSFTYDASSRVVTMTDPAGGVYLFEYDGPSGPAGASNLTKVTFPDGRTRVYFYNEAAQINGGASCATPSPVLPNALTGLQDENGVRFATWTYDCEGRATSTERAGGVEHYSFTYTSGQTSVLDPLGTSRTVDIPAQRILGVAYSTGTTQPAASGTGQVANARIRDAQGNLSSRTDYNGNRTNYSYDLARNLETSRTEGLTAAGGTTPQTRTISTQWHGTWRLPTGIAEPLRITSFTYDADGTQCGARGALCSKSIQATTDADGSQSFSATSSGSARSWAYTYNANGSVLTVNGPRTNVTDVTTYTYYANNDADLGKRGNVATITNAAGHTTSITAYNAHGQPLTIIDANGLTTTMTYDARQRLKTRTVGTEATTYDYDFAGQLAKVTLPDGSFLSYSYDGAHRLTGMEDNLGNRIAYTLDAMGNRTQEQVRDPSNALAQTRGRVFNNLSRLFQELGASTQTTEYTYDDQGNVLTVKDPLNRITANQYDALNRLKQVTSPTPISAVTQYAYDGIDQLVAVTDPRSLVTGYTVNGLGNLTHQASPDTGTTVNTYDLAGNLLTQTDAKSQVTTYVYDGLNRVTLITFHDGSKQQYAYDAGTNGIGRLASITERDPADVQTNLTAYTYDQHGRVLNVATTHAGVTHNVAYSYDAAGRLSGMTYPSGRTLSYVHDALGRVGAINTSFGGQTRPLVANVAYHPFGGVKSYTLGNGQTYTRGIDLDGRIGSYTLGAQSFAIGYDAASRISFISDVGTPANTNTYGYDNLDRLTSAVLPATPYAYTYDAVGNRLTKGSDLYSYSSTSNRIASITPSSGPLKSFTFDPNGSTTADGQNTYSYDVRGRMLQATSSLGATDYKVNALGQRIRKTNTLGDTVFHYDTQGKLIAETTAAGVRKREVLYLGDIPVGVVQ